MIIDQGIVITGSFNFTKAAEEKNAENVLIIKDMLLTAHMEPFRDQLMEPVMIS
jgi:phosphatidylserine/phosphatidylglycerophosphate/cardiolipin synthase-like enzyme